MPDYAAMYKKLFNSQTQAITILQEAQQATEEMYISASEPDIRLLDTKKKKQADNKNVIGEAEIK